MRTDTPTARAAAVDRLRAGFARTRRRLGSQPVALRWSLGLAGLVALAALVYAAAAGTSTAAGGYVRSGERFSSDDLVTIRRALDARHIRYSVDEKKRVEVAADRLDEANEVVAKLEVGRRSLSEIEKWAADSDVWSSLSTRDQRHDQAVNEALGEMIRSMEGVVSAHVMVNRPKSRGGLRPAPAATAFVYLETDGGRELSNATVESIQWLIAGAVPEVKHDAVSVFDRKGRQYLDAHNPSLGAEAKNRRRRDELRQEILDKLDWLKGAQVSVQLVAAAVAPTPAPSPAPGAEPSPSPTPTSSPPSEEVSLPALSMGVNRPLEPIDDPAPPTAAPAPVAAPPPTPAPAPAAAPGAEPSAPTRVRVWVKVPRSFYLRAMPNREPSLDDLQPLVERTKGLITTAVEHVVPPGQLDDLVIDTIPDEVPLESPSPPDPGGSDPRRVTSWWMPAGVAGGATAVVLAVAFGVLAARRPAPRPAARLRDEHGRYKIDEASDPGPGPSERVRELIRLNPEAAASVLHRWIGQGGTLG
jgi:flagellar biosynthesis/type III secretory pathway M-ring protein FliF/YscJ